MAILVSDQLKVYSLVDKTSYDNDYPNVYYSLYSRLYWSLRHTSASISYQEFKSLFEWQMMDEISSLLEEL